MKALSTLVLITLVALNISSCVVNRKSVGRTTPPKKQAWNGNKTKCPTCGDKEKKSSIFDSKERELR